MKSLDILRLGLGVALLLGGIEGCDSGSDSVVVVEPTSSGIVAGDLQSIADYQANPVVQQILAQMPQHPGDDPPAVTGGYESTGKVTAGTFAAAGTGVTGAFCFGDIQGADIDPVVVQDPSYVDAGAASFIEGSGDLFTVYTAFLSVQVDPAGATCQIHTVEIFSGRRNADGSLSDLYIGYGVIGVLGPCSGSLFVGDYQVSLGVAGKVADECSGDPGGPIDPKKVLVQVENDLVVDLLVFVDDEKLPRLQLAPLSTGTFEALPGFSVYFESLQPIAGQTPEGNDLLMGEILSGVFPPDTTPAGGNSPTYVIFNEVGTDVYFAPLPLNQTKVDIYSVVNLGLRIPGYNVEGGGFDCLCSMSPSVDPYVVGYYSYFVPGVILPEQANVHFYKVAEPGKEFRIFNGAFNLDVVSGTVTLLVQ